jgi:hypothetical protein
MQVQQNAETLARTIKAPIVDATPPADLPPIASAPTKARPSMPPATWSQA